MRRAYGSGSLRIKHGSWYGSWRTPEGARTTRRLADVSIGKRQAEKILQAMMADDREACERLQSERRIKRYAISSKPVRDWDGGVYFILAPEVGRVKIGQTKDTRAVRSGAESRLNGMRTGAPVELVLHRFLPYGAPGILESFFHRRYAAHRWNREWFEAAPVLAEIDPLTDSEAVGLFLDGLRNRCERNGRQIDTVGVTSISITTPYEHK